MLSIQDLSLAIAGRPLLNKLCWTITPGLNLVCGGEGRGKTSLLRILAGELAFDSGTVVFDGLDLRRDRQAFVSEVFWANPRSEAHEAVVANDWLGQQAKQYPRFDAELCNQLSAGMGLGEHLLKPIYMLSTGSKRKLWLAGALASGARLTLLDEPFAALDTRSIRFICDVLGEAADHPTRAWLIADYEAPVGLAMGNTLDLGD